MNAELKEVLGFICDDAGMSIDYWAETATHDEANQTYTVTLLDDCVDEDAGVVGKTVTYQDLYDASKRLASGEVKVNSATKAVCQQLVTDPSDVDYDATDADVIVQVAMFGEIVFG
jgi:hypothetical protein